MRQIKAAKQAIQKGFTLIELMIVVAIIGILASVAVPAYQDYIQTSELSGAISVVDSYKKAVSSCMSQYGTAIGCNAGVRKVPNTIGANEVEYIAALDVADGVVTLTPTALNRPGNPMILTFTPTLNVNNSTITWAVTGEGCSEVAGGPGNSPARGINCTDGS